MWFHLLLLCSWGAKLKECFFPEGGCSIERCIIIELPAKSWLRFENKKIQMFFSRHPGLILGRRILDHRQGLDGSGAGYVWPWWEGDTKWTLEVMCHNLRKPKVGWVYEFLVQGIFLMGVLLIPNPPLTVVARKKYQWKYCSKWEVSRIAHVEPGKATRTSARVHEFATAVHNTGTTLGNFGRQQWRYQASI